MTKIAFIFLIPLLVAGIVSCGRGSGDGQYEHKYLDATMEDIPMLLGEVRDIDRALYLLGEEPDFVDRVIDMVDNEEDNYKLMDFCFAYWYFPTDLATAGRLMECFDHENENVRFYAVNAFTEVEFDEYPDNLVPALIDLIEEGFQTSFVMRALARIGPDAREAVPVLLEALGDQNPDIRQVAATTLSEVGFGAGEALPDLYRALEDEVTRVRVAAGEAIVQIEGSYENLVPALIEMLAHENPIFRKDAAFVLGRIGPDAVDALPALYDVAESEDEDLRDAARDAISKIERAAI